MAAPTHEVFVVQDAKEDGAKAQWTKVAAMFAHRDGKGFDVIIPPGISLSGRLVARPITPKATNG